MKHIFAAFTIASMMIPTAFAFILEQDGINYSCSAIGSSHQSCVSKCVKYCQRYDNYPFADRCLQYASQCGPRATVDTTCSKYDSYPFSDRCLQQEDVVNIDESCN